jgi:adenylate cyclase
MDNEALLKFRYKFRKICAIVLIWQAVALLNTLYMFYFARANAGNDISFDLASSIFYTLVGAGISGFLVGWLEIFYFRQRLRQWPFIRVALLKSLLYISMLLATFFLAFVLYFRNKLNMPLFTQQIFVESFRYFQHQIIILDILFWLLILLLTFIVIEISDHFGPGGLRGYLLGRYHQPRKEIRIFMFLDIKDSTRMAEELGHHRYFHFLNDFFGDITDAVILTQGEIYQYVGDEVVVSWKQKIGLKNANFIRCFFNIKKDMERHKNKYLKKYGIIPAFKAGFSHGMVMAGTVGILKKDVVFTGDVLNTGSRIQEKCNFYEVDNLITKSLLRFLDLPDKIKSRYIDHTTLRGKLNEVEVHSLFLDQ